MSKRRILGIAVCAGILASLGGRGVQAQSLSQAKFIALLSREGQFIYNDRVAIAQQNRTENSLDILAAGPQSKRVLRTIARLTRTSNRLQALINRTTQILLGTQARLEAALPTQSSNYASIVAANALIVRSFANRNPFGSPPTTTFQ
jgi:hypothetical protein